MMNPTCTILDALQERFSRLPSQCSPEQPMFDAQGREYLVVYRTIPTSLDGKDGAIASNLPSFQLNKDYLQDFQARDLSAIGESSKIRKIAQKLDATRLLVASGDPTIGAPVVWTSPQGKSYVLGGNGRTIAFLLSSDDSYKNYVNEASQRWFNVYDTTERKGYRNLLVRDVYKVDGSPLSVAEAVKLAGASQESTAGKETPLRQALSRARGMGITKDTDLGQIVAPMALSPYTIDKFTKNNFGFFRKVMDLVPDYIRVQLTNIDDKTKPIAFDAISSVLVGRYLPVKFVQEGFGNDKEEEAIIGVLPSLVSLQQAVDNGRIYPQYDLLDKLETARSFMKLYRWKSYGDALQDYQTQCELQTSFLEPSPVCAMNKLGVAFGLYLKRMVQSSDPTKGVSDINKYIDKALEDDPNMVGMFGEPTPQEIEDKATKAFISLALPSKLGETLLQQNPSNGITDTDRIIIEALPTRFISIELEQTSAQYMFDLFKKAYETPDVEELFSLMRSANQDSIKVQIQIAKKIAEYLNVDILKDYVGSEELAIKPLFSIAIKNIEDESPEPEPEPDIEEEDTSLKPYRVAPGVADILFIHDSDGTQIQLQTRQDKSRFKEIINIIKRNASHRGWNYSRNLGSLVPSPRAKRANIGEDHPQQWFVSNWANVARGLLQDDLQVFVYEEIDPRLEASYLLEDEADLDALLAHLSGAKAKEEEAEDIEAEDSKELIISPAFPRCRYMKGILPKYAYASAPYEARKMKCPEGTFLVEQNSPVDISNYVYRYLSDVKKKEVDVPFYRAIFPASMTKYEGKKSKDVPLSSPYYIKLLQTYYEALGYDVCRTNIKGGRSDSGVFMIYLEENEELSDGGYGSRYLEPIAYIPFPQNVTCSSSQNHKSMSGSIWPKQKKKSTL